MVRKGVVVVVAMVLTSCMTSSWERHEQLVEERRQAGDYAEAVQAQKWLVENAFTKAPPEEHGPEFDAYRLLILAELLGKANEVASALRVYREVLRLDPNRAEDVLTGIGLLPLSRERREAYLDEFTQYIVTIDPGSMLDLKGKRGCWTYTAREITVRRIWTTKGPEGLERHAIYDARPWVYVAEAGQWRADGDWLADAGAEIQPVEGATNPRYQAILDANGGFYTDVAVPPCHVSGWRGPYDTADKTIYVATQLPGQ